MVTMELKMHAEQIQALIHDGLPAARRSGVRVESVSPGTAQVCLPWRDSMLRPGGSVSGPTLFAAADTALYVLVLAHCGPELMAVTADLQIRFLRRAPPGDVRARAELLSLGSRLVVGEVRLWTGEACDTPAAFASGSYMRPQPAASGTA